MPVGDIYSDTSTGVSVVCACSSTQPLLKFFFTQISSSKYGLGASDGYRVPVVPHGYWLVFKESLLPSDGLHPSWSTSTQGTASLPGQGLAVPFPELCMLGLCCLALSAQPKRCQGPIIRHRSPWLHYCHSKAIHAPQLGSSVQLQGQGIVSKCSAQRLNLVLGCSTGFCIFKAFLAVLLGLDLCQGDCRASCCQESPSEAQEGRMGSIPICHGQDGQMPSCCLNCSKLGADAVQPFLSSALHPSSSFGSPGTLTLREQSRQKTSSVKNG